MNWRKELESFDMSFGQSGGFMRENKNVLIWGKVEVTKEQNYSGDDMIGTTHEYHYEVQGAIILSEEVGDYSEEVQEILNEYFK